MEKILTKRAILRRFRLTDLDNMILLESDPDVMKFTPSRKPHTKEKSEERLKSLIQKEVIYAPLGVWALELQDTAEFIGWLMLIKTEFEVPEIGFMIVKDHWGKGFASEAAQALIDFGMNDLKYTGIAAVTDHDNKASIHVLEKLGFQKKSSKTKLDQVLDREVETYVFELRQP